MRLFETLAEAIPEIRRDLAKSPTLPATRVQNEDILYTQMVVQEAMAYSYTIAAGGIPDRAGDLIKLAKENFALYRDDPEFLRDTLRWLGAEELARCFPLSWRQVEVPDLSHPVLKNYVEGHEFSYVYSDRLIGACLVMANTLKLDPTSRRAFWPVFLHQDAIRSHRMTRIPCTLGYQFLIRDVPGQGPFLHVVYLSRSTDFEKFWITDLYLAHALQRVVLKAVQSDGSLPHLRLGGLTHFATSLHRFAYADEEQF